MRPADFSATKWGMHLLTIADGRNESNRTRTISFYVQKCHRGWLNARNCRNLKGVFWDTLYEHDEVGVAAVAALTLKMGDHPSSNLLSERQAEKKETSPGLCNSSVYKSKAVLSGNLDKLNTLAVPLDKLVREAILRRDSIASGQRSTLSVTEK